MYYAKHIKRLRQVCREVNRQRHALRLLQERGVLSVTLTTTAGSLTVLPLEEALNPFFFEYAEALSRQKKALKQEIREVRAEWQKAKEAKAEDKEFLQSNPARALRGRPTFPTPPAR